jgi:hypothetical protein
VDKFSRRYLTKSRFQLAIECPTKLYYLSKDAVYRNHKKEDSFMEALAEGGFQVGAMAKLLYPDGIEIEERGNTNALMRTKELLSQHDSITLFEPAFEFEGLLARVDILAKLGNRVDLIEVKAKSYDSDSPQIKGKRTPILNAMRSYIEDVAFQKHVVTNALPGFEVRCFLMMPDKTVASVVDGLNQCFKIKKVGNKTETHLSTDAEMKASQCQSLLAKVAVDEFVDIVLSKPLEYPGSLDTKEDYLPSVVKRWSEAYASDIKIQPTLQKNCAGCEFREPLGGPLKSGFHECLQQSAGLTPSEVDQGTVLDIWNYRNKDALIARGSIRLDQVQDDDINIKSDRDGLSSSERQWLQIRGIPAEDDKGGFYFDVEYFQTQMHRWRYPLHMIDFETCTVALPFFKGGRPYEPIAFQFSHHVVYQDGHIEHKDQALITTPGEFPNFSFVRTLKKALEVDDGTIFRWAAHENTILRQIKSQLLASNQPPDDRDALIVFIDQVTDSGPRSMIDLNEIALRSYFHPETKGRTSIKKILPAVMATSQYLKKKYSLPIYGTEIRSLNYPEGFVWHEKVDGLLKDPYERLKLLSMEMLGGKSEEDFEGVDGEQIAEGGAAAMAYARLQFEDLGGADRGKIEQALLRYCELDTFAMVMILESWMDWADKLNEKRSFKIN